MTKEAKTTSAPLDRELWLAGVEEGRRAEAVHQLGIFAETTGWEPRLWGASMVGYGRYEYCYEGGHAGESLATGFSSRKAELSLYGLTMAPEAEALLAGLGPHRTGKACLYVKRLAVVDAAVLRALIRAGEWRHWRRAGRSIRCDAGRGCRRAGHRAPCDGVATGCGSCGANWTNAGACDREGRLKEPAP